MLSNNPGRPGEVAVGNRRGGILIFSRSIARVVVLPFVATVLAAAQGLPGTTGKIESALRPDVSMEQVSYMTVIKDLNDPNKQEQAILKAKELLHTMRSQKRYREAIEFIAELGRVSTKQVIVNIAREAITEMVLFDEKQELEVVKAAAKELGKIKSPEAIEALLAGIRRAGPVVGSAPVREDWRKAIIDGFTDEFDLTATKIIVDMLRDRLFKIMDPETELVLLTTLCNIDELTDEREVKDRILQTFIEVVFLKQDNEVRRLAIAGMRHSDAPHAISVLLYKILLNPNEKEKNRGMAAFIIADIGGEYARTSLVEALRVLDRDKEEKIRKDVIASMPLLHSSNVIDILMEIINDEKESDIIRTTAADAMGYLEPFPMEHVIDLLNKEKNIGIREELIKGLGREGDERGIECLINILIDKEKTQPSNIRIASLNALVRMIYRGMESARIELENVMKKMPESDTFLRQRYNEKMPLPPKEKLPDQGMAFNRTADSNL